MTRTEMENLGYTYITPKLAEEWLSKNYSNRIIRKRFVSQLAKKIKNGEWQKDTTDHIGFYVDGVLANGQHRLLAIIEADTPVYTKVDYNIPKEAAICIDTGNSRSFSDNVKIITGETYYTSKISKIVAQSGVNGKNYTHEDHLYISIAFKDELITIKDLFRDKPRYISSTDIMSAVLMAYIANVDIDTLTEFVTVLSSGRAYTDNQEMIIRLRDRIQFDFLNGKGDKNCNHTANIKRIQNVIYNYSIGNQLSVIKYPEQYRYPLIDFLNMKK